MARVLIISLLLSVLFAASAEGADRRFVVVVGYNGSDDPNLAALSYADDDAIRHAEVLGASAERVVTLTQLDEDSTSLWGDRAVRAPTRVALVAALEATHAAMDEARAEGDRPILVFAYSGHGNYDRAGRGYVHIQGGRFTTRDLYEHVIIPAGESPVLLLVDACNGALLVRSRGPRPATRPAGPSTLKFEDYPNVGVVLASTSVGETHEWGRYLAGIFSHEVRSGLLGAADLDDDRRVGFAELAAFLQAANADVANPSLRVKPYVRPPLSDPELPFVDWTAAPDAPRVRLPGELAGRVWVADEHVVRYADLHKAAGHAFWMHVPRPGHFVLVSDEAKVERVFEATVGRSVPYSALPERPRTELAARSATSAYFDRTLYRRPFEPRPAARWLEQRWVDGLEIQRTEPRPWYRNNPAWAVVGAGAASMGAGVGFHLSARQAAGRAAGADWADDADEHNRRANKLQTFGRTFSTAGAAALIGGAVWMALDRPPMTSTHRPPLSVMVTPAGVSLRSNL